MSDEVNVAYYAIIPATVRYDKDVSPNAKLLYGEITALCNREGFCWAGNSYFADLYGVADRSVQRWIDALVSKGYVVRNIQYEADGKTILRRCLSIDASCVTTPRQKCRGGYDKNVAGVTTKMSGRIIQENNTRKYYPTDCQDGRGDICDDDFNNEADDDNDPKKWFLNCLQERVEEIRKAFREEGIFDVEHPLVRFENLINNLPTPLIVNGSQMAHEKYLQYLCDFFRCPPKDAFYKLEDIIGRVDGQAELGVVKNRFHYLLSSLLNASQGI